MWCSGAARLLLCVAHFLRYNVSSDLFNTSSDPLKISYDVLRSFATDEREKEPTMVFVPVVEIRKLPSFLSFKRIGRKKTKKPTAETHELFHGSFGSDVWDPFDLLNTEAVNESTLESTDNSSDGAAPDLASCSNGSSDNSGTRRSVDGWIGKKPTVSEMVEKVELKT